MGRSKMSKRLGSKVEASEWSKQSGGSVGDMIQMRNSSGLTGSALVKSLQKKEGDAVQMSEDADREQTEHR